MRKMRIFHCVRVAIPYASGSSIRTKYIVETQKKWYDVMVLVSNYKHKKKQTELGFQYMINEIPYFICDKNYLLCKFLYKKRPLSVLESCYNIMQFRSFIINLCKKLKPDIIHGHSSFNIGLPALLSAKHLRIPFIYELRSMTEYSRLANRILKAKSTSMSWIRFWERYVISNADGVVCINRELCRDILRRKLVDVNNCISVPNGVDTSRFFPSRPNQKLKRMLKLNENFIIGMVSPRYHEGIFFLLDSVTVYFKRYRDDRLVIIGNGRDSDEDDMVRRKIVECGLNRNVLYLGRVPHRDMNDYYSIMDILVLPRLNTKENNLVTPLKLLEMMAAGKVILVSDVGGLTSMVQDGKTGHFFKSEDSYCFIKKLIAIRNNGVYINRIGNNARTWMVKNRSWRAVVSKYEGIYHNVLKKNIGTKS